MADSFYAPIILEPLPRALAIRLTIKGIVVALAMVFIIGALVIHYDADFWPQSVQDDPRFQSTFSEMFINPTKDLQQHKYPFTQR